MEAAAVQAPVPRMAGKVKAWNEESSTGLIKPLAGGGDVLVHRSDLADGQWLTVGAIVRFEDGWDPTLSQRVARKVSGAARILAKEEADAVDAAGPCASLAGQAAPLLLLADGAAGNVQSCTAGAGSVNDRVMDNAPKDGALVSGTGVVGSAGVEHGVRNAGGTSMMSSTASCTSSSRVVNASMDAGSNVAWGATVSDPLKVGNILCGKVKSWVEETGMGLIQPFSGGDNVFVHRSELTDGQWLSVGAIVKFQESYDPELGKRIAKQCSGAARILANGISGGIGVESGMGPIGGSGKPTPTVGQRLSGTVKSWIEERGMGFVKPDTGGDDAFVHRRALTDGAYLVVGSPVTFEDGWDVVKMKRIATKVTGAVPVDGQGGSLSMSGGMGMGMGMDMGIDANGLRGAGCGTRNGMVDGMSIGMVTPMSMAMGMGMGMGFGIPMGMGMGIPMCMGMGMPMAMGMGMGIGMPISVGMGMDMGVDMGMGMDVALGLNAGASCCRAHSGMISGIGTGNDAGTIGDLYTDSLSNANGSGVLGLVDGITLTGTVKAWIDERGMGFIKPDGGGEDIFVHRSDLVDAERLVVGSVVTFESAWDPVKGKRIAKKCSGPPPNPMGVSAGMGGAGSNMQSGTIKMWFEDKAFGFIVPDAGGCDVMVHKNEVMEGLKLVRGMPVRFEAAWDSLKGKFKATRCISAETSVSLGVDISTQDNLFVAGLPIGTSEERLGRIFGQFGVVTSCKVLPHGSKPDCAAMVRMSNANEAAWALQNLNGQVPEGFPARISVRYAQHSIGKGGSYQAIGKGGMIVANRFCPYSGSGVAHLAGSDVPAVTCTAHTTSALSAQQPHISSTNVALAPGTPDASPQTVALSAAAPNVGVTMATSASSLGQASAGLSAPPPALSGPTSVAVATGTIGAVQTWIPSVVPPPLLGTNVGFAAAASQTGLTSAGAQAMPSIPVANLGMPAVAGTPGMAQATAGGTLPSPPTPTPASANVGMSVTNRMPCVGIPPVGVVVPPPAPGTFGAFATGTPVVVPPPMFVTNFGTVPMVMGDMNTGVGGFDAPGGSAQSVR